MSYTSESTSPALSTASSSSCSCSRCTTPSSVATSPRYTNIGGNMSDNGCRDDDLPSPSVTERSKTTSCKNNKPRRTSFFAYQLAGLRQVFEKEQYPDPAQRQKIAEALDLDFVAVTRWFNNRRANLRRGRVNRKRKSDVNTTGNRQKKAKFSSSFNIENILRRSPSPNSESGVKSRTDADGQMSPPPQTGVNGYYQHFPRYYPAYVYHYYPNVQAHHHSPVSMATERPIPSSPEKPLDLSLSKTRQFPAKENLVPSPEQETPNQASGVGRNDREDDLAKSTSQDTNDVYYSKPNYMYSPGYYRPYPNPRGAMYHKPGTDFGLGDGYVPMTSLPLQALQDCPATLMNY